MTISYAMLSKVGNRKQNEDSIRMYDRDGRYVFALADGLGGHGQGELASRSVVTQAIEVFKKAGARENYIPLAFQNAQDCLLQQKEAAGAIRDMETTMVLLHISKTHAQWGHVGDSRLYYIRDGRIAGRTSDHSVPQMLLMSGDIRESEIRHHPDRNKVLRVMGTPWEMPAYEVSEPAALEVGQAFLLCTDGFWEYITEKEMEKALKKSASVAEWLGRMEAVVLENGRNEDMDNYSAICVYVGE